jgi:site-specific DNA recombinase
MGDSQKINDCVAYCRVSSNKQAQQGESIEDQQKLAVHVAATRNLRIVPDNKVFIETYSGRKTIRPEYEALKKYIKDHSGIKFCLIRGIDRFTRGGAMTYETMKNELESLGVELIDSYGIIQPKQNTLAHLGVEYTWSKYSPSKASELMEAHRGERELTDILTRMIGAEINLVRDGYKVRPANDGFKNEKIFVDSKKKVIQIPDPDRAHFLIKMFELSVTHTDKEVVDCLDAMGYRSKSQNKWSKSKDKIIGHTEGVRLSIKKLQTIRQRPIYCGVNTEKWLPSPLRTKYAGLVSIDIFNKANKGKVFIEEKEDGSIKVHKDYNIHQLKRSRDNPLFPHKSVVLCPICRKPFLGSSPAGKSRKGFPTYHCARNHKYLGINKVEFDKQLTQFVSNLKCKDEGFIKSLEATLMNKYREKEKELGEFSVKVGTTVIELETEKKQKIEAYTSTKNEIIRTELEKQINDLHEQIEKARDHRNGLEIQENDIHSFVRYVKDLMEHPVEMLVKQQDITTLKGLFGVVFDELPTFEEIVNGTPKLSLTYRLSEEFHTNKSLSVTLPGIEPGFEP